MIYEFYKPQTPEEAVKLRSEKKQSVYIAGGTEINSHTNRLYNYNSESDIENLISISQLSLKKIEKNNSYLSIGANVIIQEIIEHPDMPELLKQAAHQFANRNIRNIATIVGNIAANKSCSNLIPALLVLEASLVIMNMQGKKKITLSDYILQQDKRDLILSIEIPSDYELRSYSTRKYSRTINDISIVSVAVTMKKNLNNKIEKPLFAVGGVDQTVIRLNELEKRLDGSIIPTRDELETLTKLYVSPISDLRGSAEFKQHIAASLLSWAVYDAVKRGN